MGGNTLIKIVSVIGARPQFIKAAPMELAMKENTEILHFSIHTGQHYDANMSEVFFTDLGLQKPYINLECGSGSHAQQTAAIMVGLEPVLQKIAPHIVVVYGDTNSTIATALVAAKLHISVAHIEAGLRSFNKEMPEEVNRILTDHCSDVLFAPTQEAIRNLEREGLCNAIKTGDVMLDMASIAINRGIGKQEQTRKYYYATLHRPYNTDNKERLVRILNALNSLENKVIFSIHPRTKNKMQQEYQIDASLFSNIEFIEPQGYFENLALLGNAECLITDSGGMQKEAYFLQRRCLTLRSETEWVETLENNCNTLVWDDLESIGKILLTPFGPFNEQLYGTGSAAVQIVNAIVNFVKSKEIK